MSNTRDAQVLKLLQESDPSSARILAQEVAAALDELAAQLWAFGLAEGSRRGLAVIAQIGGELAVASCVLYESERWYAGAALVRQLIEVEYLMFLFGANLLEPSQWLEASPEEARSAFSPAIMRKRSSGRFNVEEYSAHCEMGGHPRIRGAALLREHRTLRTVDGEQLTFSPQVQWVDLAQHLVRLWEHYELAVGLHSPTNVYPAKFALIREKISAWKEADPVPGRI